MRLFIAILIPSDLMQQLGRLQAQLKAQLSDPALRWVAPENFHFTLLFLGEQPEERLPAIEEAMRTAAQQVQPFEVTIEGLGVFPNRQRPSVLWVGANAGVEPMGRVATTLERLLLGRADKPFHAHVTLARIKMTKQKALPATPLPDRLQKAMEQLQPATVGQFTATHLSLMQSELHPSGSRYTELRKVYFH
ncbi:MAG: RNA 2',3'-cyclic phosphodiesterase [Fimbriimonadales bacterium]|nr:RNA 2',3'-cyclic phosphodiesterase [Fimbriimonadales bacterium]